MRVLAASSILMLLVVPAWARQEQNIKKVASVNIVLPSGEGCEGKVVKRTPDAYSVKLIAETSVCGDRNDVILIRQARVRSILRDRQLSHPVLRVIAGYLVFSVPLVWPHLSRLLPATSSRSWRFSLAAPISVRGLFGEEKRTTPF